MDDTRKLLSAGRSLGRNVVAVSILIFYVLAVGATVLAMLGATVRIGLFLQSEFWGHLTATAWNSPMSATIGVVLLAVTVIMGFVALFVVSLVLHILFDLFFRGPLELPLGCFWVGVGGMIGTVTVGLVWMLPIWESVLPGAADLLMGLRPKEDTRNALSMAASLVPLAAMSVWYLDLSAVAGGEYGYESGRLSLGPTDGGSENGSLGATSSTGESATTSSETDSARSSSQSTSSNSNRNRGRDRNSSGQSDDQPVEPEWSKSQSSPEREREHERTESGRAQGLDISDLDYAWTTETDVSMEDVGGMEGVKKKLDRKIINLLRDEEMRKSAAELDISLPNVILHGPPGTGKTYLARALASEIGLPFVKVTGGDITTKWVNESPEKINNLFSEGRKIAAKEGGAVIFLDEMDAVLAKRGGSNSHRENEKVVDEFLAHLDETDQHNILFVGATNRRDALDPAVVRKGRIDEEIEVPEPDHDARVAIFKAQVHKRSHDLTEQDFQKLARETDGMVAADIEAIVDEASRNLLYDGTNRSQLRWADFETAIDGFEE